MKYDIVFRKNEADLCIELWEDAYNLLLGEKSKLLGNMLSMYHFETRNTYMYYTNVCMCVY